jgi:acyl carrier protein
MSDTRQRLINCFQSVFPNLGPAEVPVATMASVATWDSLAGASLLTVIEEEFSVQVAPEDFDRFVSFELILDYLERT